MAAQQLSDDVGLQLFENAAATAAALVAIILAIGPVSGAHLNPVVTLADRFFGGISTREAGVYVGAQLAGGALGAVVANLMFSLPAVELSTKVRSSGGLWLGEVVATFGLLLVIFALVRSGRTSAAFRRRGLHRRRLLLHLVDQRGQPGGDDRPGTQRQLRRHRPESRAGQRLSLTSVIVRASKPVVVRPLSPT